MGLFCYCYFHSFYLRGIVILQNPVSNREEKGHLEVKLKEVGLFVVTGFRGTPQHNYICVQANKVLLLHCCEYLLEYTRYTVLYVYVK